MIIPNKLTGNTYILEDHSFDELIKLHYGIDNYEFFVQYEMRNGDSKLFSNITKKFKSNFQKRDYSDFLASKPDINTPAYLFLRDMVIRNILPPGNYIIPVFW